MALLGCGLAGRATPDVSDNSNAATSMPVLPENPTTEQESGTSDSTWDRYEPRTLAEIIEITDPFFENAPAAETYYAEILAEYHYPSQVKMIYSGEFREISDKRKLVIWSASTGNMGVEKGEELYNRFTQEVRFTENGVDYWMPVQDPPLIPYMKEELSSGDEVTLFVIWLGAVWGPDGSVDRVFVVNEFKK
jgi:hypothetical protein